MTLSQWLHDGIEPYIDYHQHRYARTLAAVLPPGGHWLDIGAGSRIHGGWLAPTPADLAARAALLVGCDVEAAHLRQHPHLASRAVALGEALPFRPNRFDVVSSNMVLEHLADPARVFAEIARVLKPGGAFVFVTPNRSHPVIWILSLLLQPRARRLLARVVERHRAVDRVFLTHYRANTTTAVGRLAREAALAVENVSAFSSFPMFGRFPPAFVVESLWIRMTASRFFRGGGSNLLGVLRKPHEGSAVSPMGQ